jgi:hypothetical protein
MDLLESILVLALACFKKLLCLVTPLSVDELDTNDSLRVPT